jgi:hypothetical protein
VPPFAPEPFVPPAPSSGGFDEQATMADKSAANEIRFFEYKGASKRSPMQSHAARSTQKVARRRAA